MVAAQTARLLAGAAARMLMPGYALPEDEWTSVVGSRCVLGLAGALLGYLIFTVLLGIGDTDIFDWWAASSAPSSAR